MKLRTAIARQNVIVIATVHRTKCKYQQQQSKK